VTVDYELRGCPIDRGQLLDTLAALLAGRKPRLPAATVCTECKRSGVTCVTVAEGIACLGPVTHAGCGALCPSHHRGCYGCFGPTATPNMGAVIPLLRRDGMSGDDVDRVFDTFNVTQFTAERNSE
jgi:coenzyme F420-reducing hydrogenase gamma subunit